MATPKKTLSKDHPMIAAGFLHESHVRDAFEFSESYWREWLRKQRVPHRTIGGHRWFHRDSLIAWFASPVPDETDDECADQSPNRGDET